MEKRTRNPRTRFGIAALLSAATLAVTGCGLEPAASFVPAVEPGEIAEVPGAADADPITVTSKQFTEQLILGKIAVLAAEAAGYEVVDLTNVPGSQPSRELIVSGGADVGYEYTGTAWLTYLGQEESIPDTQEMWEAVAAEDAENGVVWGEPMPLNNTYAFAVRPEAAAEFGDMTTLSEIGEVPVEERTFCVDAEFNSRVDGMNPMLDLYELPRGDAEGVPDDQIGIYDIGAIYSATAAGDCNFGEVFTTDGRIDALDLVVLEDDRQFFPAYNAAPTFHAESLPNHEEYKEVLDSFGGRLTNEVMRQLNLRVDVEGEEPADVAFDWMVSEGLVTDPNA